MLDNTTPELLLRVTGMDCADCARTIERGVRRLSGVDACSVNFGAATLRVSGSAGAASITGRIRELGYDIEQDAPAAAQHSWLTRLPETGAGGFLRFLLSKRDTALAVLGAFLILPSLIFQELFPFLGVSGPWLDVSAILALAIAGGPVLLAAWRAIRITRQININVLMVIAAIGALVIGAYTEAGMVMVLFAIGEALEGFTADRARSSITSLLSVAPAEAILLARDASANTPDVHENTSHVHENTSHVHVHENTSHARGFSEAERTVPVHELRIGDVILIKPGARVPMDGVIVQGESSINQAAISGESVPRECVKGDTVYAGSINGEGALQVRVSALVGDNLISRIVHQVQEAQDNKAPTERFVDSFARWYTPLVVGLAIVIALLPPVLFGQPFWGNGEDGAPQGWLYRALELLVVACPCALVISTPVTIISALSNAARNGVLIKGGAHLEALARIKAFAFDKTGTLTEGEPRVLNVQSAHCSGTDDCVACDDLLALTAALERRSEHPLARAVIKAAEARGVAGRYPAAEQVQALTGRGVQGTVAATNVLIGSHAYFDASVPHPAAACDDINRSAAKGETLFLVSHNNQYAGYIATADTVRASSRAAIAALHAQGLQHSVMLTGDTAMTADKIARDVGVSDVRAGLLPDQKASAIQQLQRDHGSVAMVGDGINDAPALATANLGIAMGAGSAQAIEVADIALLSNDLHQLPYAVQLARAALRTVRFNITFAIGVKLAFLVLVLLGLGNLWLAVLADVGAAFFVSIVGLRMLRYRARET